MSVSGKSNTSSDLSGMSDLPPTADELKRMEEYKSQIESSKKVSIELFISGPNKMITMKKGSQQVRLFGEWHGHDNNCTSVEQLRGKRIYTILEYLDAELDKGGLDLYIEAPIVHLQDPKTMSLFHTEIEMKKKYEQTKKEKKAKDNIKYELEPSCYLSITRNALKWCINPFYRYKCKYNNSRVHSTDLRWFYSFGEMTKGLRNIKSEIKWKIFKKKYSKQANILGSIKNCEDYAKYILNLIYNYKPVISIDTKNPRKSKKSQPILKQLKKSGISQNDLYSGIYNVCKKRNVVKWVQNYAGWLKSEKPVVVTPQNAQELMDTTQEQLSIMHDIYTFLRMIKPIDGELQKNIIFYGGLAHTEALQILLESVGFQVIPNNSKTLAERCVNIFN
jgi:hypothetical protein